MFSLVQKLLGGRATPDAGELGERLAAEWLQRERHFAVVVRNWRSPRDRREENDLVCRDVGVLVFIEVKARAAGALVSGYHAVNDRKKRVLRRAIKTYLAQLRDKPLTFRFDIVEVGFAAAGVSTSTPQIYHFENVPLFEKHFRG
jgi:putative endonuclease